MKQDSLIYWIVFTIIFVIVLFAGAYLVSLLWNFLMPGLFGLATINTKQALAMVILCNWLFGGSSSVKNMTKGA